MEKTELRIGVYESSNTLCMYLESDASGSTLENNLWVKFRIAVMNQRHPEKSEWKESAICTKTWNNSVLQFSKVSLVLLSCICQHTVIPQMLVKRRQSSIS